MKTRILRIIIATLVMMMVAVLLIVAYFMLIDMQTKMPDKNTYTCNVTAKKFMGRNIFIIEPKNVEKTNLNILYFHGGSYVAEATEQHWDFLERIVNDTGSTIIFPDYPLTPKYGYKDVFRMVVPLYKEIIERVDSKDLIIMGDSAGGGLGLALGEKLSEENVALPSKTILISPWLDVRLTNPKITEIEKLDKQLNRDALKLAGIAYAKDDGMDSYLVNPIDGDFSKLENITIFTGTYDILNPDVHELQKKAEEQGTSINIYEYDKASHIWIIQNQDELANKAYNDLIECIKN